MKRSNSPEGTGNRPLPKAAPHVVSSGTEASVTDAQTTDAALSGDVVYRVVADGAYDWEYFRGIDGCYLYVSPSCERISGYSAPEFLSDPDLMRRIVHSDDRIVWDNHNEQACTEDNPAEIEFRINRRDGPIVWLGHVCQCIFDQEGRRLGRRGSNRDITGQKLAQAALRENEERYRLIFEGSKEGIVFVGADGVRQAVNPRLAEMCGFTVEELQGKSAFSWIHPDDLDCLKVNHRRRLAGEVFEHTYEFRVIHKDGHTVIVEGTFDAVKRDNKIDGVCGILRDVSERKRAGDALRESETRFRNFMESNPSACLLFDSQLNYLYFNKAAQELTGVTLAQALGRNISEFIPDLNGTERYGKYMDVLRTGQPAFMEAHAPGGMFGDRQFSIRAFRVGDNLGVIWTDVTERTRSEKERLRLKEQVLYAQKLESIGILAGGIAHDFNNILTSILGGAALALDDIVPDSPAYARIQEIELAARKAAALTRQMLAYSGRGKFLIQPVNLCSEVRKLAPLLQASLPNTCRITWQFANDVPLIEADANQIGQVVMNLVMNAAEAIGEDGGVITIGVGAMGCDRACLSQSYFDDNLPDGQYVFLEVSDTGCGIAPEIHPQLFDPFFTTKFTGRGLGLAAVLGIVRGHRGAVYVTSEFGRGSTFRVLFPAREPPIVLENGGQERSNRVSGAGAGLVLVIDDEDSVRKFGGLALERAGFCVMTASNGMQGIEIFRKHVDEICLVVLDMAMPVMDGVEVFREIHAIRSDAKVLLTSGYSEMAVRRRFEDDEAVAFIQKPYGIRELQAKVFEAIGDRG